VPRNPPSEYEDVASRDIRVNGEITHGQPDGRPGNILCLSSAAEPRRQKNKSSSKLNKSIRAGNDRIGGCQSVIREHRP